MQWVCARSRPPALPHTHLGSMTPLSQTAACRETEREVVSVATTNLGPANALSRSLLLFSLNNPRAHGKICHPCVRECSAASAKDSPAYTSSRGAAAHGMDALHARLSRAPPRARTLLTLTRPALHHQHARSYAHHHGPVRILNRKSGALLCARETTMS